jgi:hypothetical protein
MSMRAEWQHVIAVCFGPKVNFPCPIFAYPARVAAQHDASLPRPCESLEGGHLVTLFFSFSIRDKFTADSSWTLNILCLSWFIIELTDI